MTVVSIYFCFCWASSMSVAAETSDLSVILHDHRQWLKCKIRGGERYIYVWAPDNGRVPFPSIITIWGGGTTGHTGRQNTSSEQHQIPVSYFEVKCHITAEIVV